MDESPARWSVSTWNICLNLLKEEMVIYYKCGSLRGDADVYSMTNPLSPLRKSLV